MRGPIGRLAFAIASQDAEVKRFSGHVLDVLLLRRVVLLRGQHRQPIPSPDPFEIALRVLRGKTLLSQARRVRVGVHGTLSQV